MSAMFVHNQERKEMLCIIHQISCLSFTCDSTLSSTDRKTLTFHGLTSGSYEYIAKFSLQ